MSRYSNNVFLSESPADVTIGSLTISSLSASEPIKTNSAKQLISTKLALSDVTGLENALTTKTQLDFIEGSTPSNPSSGELRLYSKNDGNMYILNNVGVELPFLTGAQQTIGWTFSNLLAGSPASGYFRFDNATPSSVTEIQINVENNVGSNQRPILQTLKNGDKIYLCDSDGDNCKLYKIDSDPIDNTTYFQLPVVLENENNIVNYINDEDITFLFIAAVNDLQSSYNASITPQITTDDNGDQFTIKRGTTGGDSDIVLEVLNGSDVSTFSVTGEGVVNAENVVIEGKNVKTFTVDNSSTGFLGDPPVLSINANPALFNMSAGTLQHVNNTTGLVSEVVVPAQTGVAPSFILSGPNSWISIDSSGAIVQRNVGNTPQQNRETALVGLCSHIDNIVIDNVINQQQINLNPESQSRDLMNALGFFLTGGNEISTPPASLQVNKAAGTGFSTDANVNVNPSDPHNIVLASQTPATLFQITQDLSSIVLSSTVDPTVWDNGGVLTAVPSNNNATIARLYLFVNGTIAWMYGQEVYSTFTIAKTALGTESFIIPPEVVNGVFLGRWVTKKGTTALDDNSEALFVPNSSIGSSSGSVVTMQSTYNVSTSPQILTNSTNGSVQIQNGQSLNTDNQLEILDIAGTTTFSVDGAGLATAADLRVNNDKIHIGSGAGVTTQGVACVAIGKNAGNITQGDQSVAVGQNAGNLTQGEQSVAIGPNAGQTTQADNSVAIGRTAGNSNQGTKSVAVGQNAGRLTQGANCVAVGLQSGEDGQQGSAVAIGQNAGRTDQGSRGISIGQNAGMTSQGADSICIGMSTVSTGVNSIAIGKDSTAVAYTNSIALGNTATSLANNELKIGSTTAGTTITDIVPGIDDTTDLGSSTIGFKDIHLAGTIVPSEATKIGLDACGGSTSLETTGVGYHANAGVSGSAATWSTALGAGAAEKGSATGSLSVGYKAHALSAPGTYSIAIGSNAAQTNAGTYSIAIGRYAGNNNLAANAICINSTGAILENTTASSFVVKPVRGIAHGIGVGTMFYNSTTGEISYSTT